MKFSQFAVVLALVAVYTSAAEISTNPSSSRFFNRKLQKQMKSFVDPEGNACEDLYQYACGKWAEVNSISDEEGSNEYTSAVAKVNYEINEELSQYMSVMSLRHKPEFVIKANAFYKSCVATADDYKLILFMEWMQQHENMTWALLSASETEHKFDWVHTLGLMRRYGLNGVFLEEASYQRYEDLWRTIIDLDKPVSNGGFANLTEDNFKTLNESLPEEVQSRQSLWPEISAFEERLLQLNEIKDESETSRITVKDLPLSWLFKYLAIVLNQTSLDLNMDVQIENIPYMKALDALLQEYSDEFLCRYLEVRFLWHLYETPPYITSTDCVAATRGFLSLPMNWIYEQQHPELVQEIPKIHELFDNVHGFVNKTLHSDKSGLVTKEMLDKLDKIQLKVGNLPRLDTNKVLDDFYAGLSINASDFYGNLLKVHQFYFNASHSGYGNLLTANISQLFYVDEYNDGCSYLPYYQTAANVVIAPLTLMRQPFYHWGYDDVYKYSSLGIRFAYVIVENIFGLVEFDDLMSEDVEKIAQINSIHAAYGAYNSLLPEELKKDEHFMRGTKMIFFLNYAQHYCDANEATALNSYVSHFPEYSETFDCKLRNFLESLMSLPTAHK